MQSLFHSGRTTRMTAPQHFQKTFPLTVSLAHCQKYSPSEDFLSYRSLLIMPGRSQKPLQIFQN